MASIEQELKRAAARGDKKVNGFSGAVRSLENAGLEEGDTFKIPEKFDVYEQKLGTAKVQYIMVELENGNAKPFYPSTLTKTRTIYDQDGSSTGQRVSTKGSAAELFRQFGSVAEAMDALKGKTLKVTALEEIDTLRYGTTQLMKAQIPTIDIVEK